LVDHGSTSASANGLIHFDLPAHRRQIRHHLRPAELGRIWSPPGLRTAARCSSRREVVGLDGVESATPEIRYRVAGETHTLACDLIAAATDSTRLPRRLSARDPHHL